MNVTKTAKGGATATALALFIGLVPTTAWACGACTDNMIQKLAWWATFPLWVLAALLVDALGYFVYCKVRRIRGPRASWPRTLTWLLFGGFVLFLAGVGAGRIIAAAVFSVAMGVRFKRSFERLDAVPPKERLWATRVRLGLLVAVVLAFFVRAMPPLVPTDRLLSRATYNVGTPEALCPRNWMEKELQRRKPVREIEAAIQLERGVAPRLVERREAALLFLHQLAGGPESFRASACERWREHGPQCQSAMSLLCPAPQ